MTGKEKICQAFDQSDCLWTSGKAIKKLHKITSMSKKKDIRSWLEKVWQVHIPVPKKIHHPHYDVTKPNEQNRFDLLYMSHKVFEENTYKYILAGIDVALRYKVARALRTKNQVKLHFFLEAISKMGGMFKYSKVFQCDDGSEFKNEVKNTILIFEGQRRNTSILIRPFWKPLTKSWQNSCLNRWMSKSFKTLKKFRQFELKI